MFSGDSHNRGKDHRPPRLVRHVANSSRGLLVRAPDFSLRT